MEMLSRPMETNKEKFDNLRNIFWKLWRLKNWGFQNQKFKEMEVNNRIQYSRNCKQKQDSRRRSFNKEVPQYLTKNLDS